MKCLLATFVVCFGLISSAQACEKNMAIDNAWVRPSMPGKNMTAAFFDVKNQDDAPYTLTGISVKDALGEIHTTIEENGIFKMRPMPEVTVAAGETVQFKPKSLHVMLLHLKQPLQEGDKVIMTLYFDNGENHTMHIPVKAAP